ncbi:MAG: hypothetical protein WC565_07925 [Parcubacteria group bacterium]
MIWYIAGGCIVVVFLLFIYSLCNIAGILDEAERRRMTIAPKDGKR